MKSKFKKKEDKKEVLFFVVLILFILSAISLFTVFVKINYFQEIINGYASEVSTMASVTIIENLSITLDSSSINWGGGMIGNGSNNATLMTMGNSSNMSDSSWDNSSVIGIILRNNGNVNVSLNITFKYNVTEFFGPLSYSGKDYSINISNKEAGSCDGLGITLNSWLLVNKSNWLICEKMSYYLDTNEIWIDAKLIVPYDSNNTNQDITDEITITASAAL
ncbi:hypothetical protein GOV12_00240 [Candidatus Pacearchaeota archaeon]|nr:hypothetical protein [Candidatus Pacearchaeota archaeon]